MKGRYCPGCGYDLSQLVSITNQANLSNIEQPHVEGHLQDEKIKQIVENVKRGRGRPRKSEGMKKIPIPKPQTEPARPVLEEPVEQSIPKQEPKPVVTTQAQITFKPLF